MRRGGWILAVVLVVAASATAYGFNLFETAGPVGAQQVAMTFGFGLGTTEFSPAGVWFLAPQGRLTIGLMEGLDLGVQSGWTTEIGATTVHWLGTLVDVKIASIHVPDMYTLAWGAGGGYGLDLLGDGWGVFWQILFESHSRFLPIFVTYRSLLPFDGMAGGSIAFEGYIAGGLRLPLAPIAQLLLVVDVHGGLASIGLGLEIAF